MTEAGRQAYPASGMRAQQLLSHGPCAGSLLLVGHLEDNYTSRLPQRRN